MLPSPKAGLPGRPWQAPAPGVAVKSPGVTAGIASCKELRGLKRIVFFLKYDISWNNSDMNYRDLDRLLSKSFELR